MRTRSNAASSFDGSRTGSMLAPRTIAASSARRQPSTGRSTVSGGRPSKPHHRARADAGEPRQPAPPVEPHQQCLRLVVGVMRGQHDVQSPLPGMAGEGAVAGVARAVLHIARLRRDGEHGMRHAARRAHPRDGACLSGAFRP